tara:strand:+ start:1756 stop:1926 length:171 start_codon:yes stop_codon:yes gene_type:complete
MAKKPQGRKLGGNSFKKMNCKYCGAECPRVDIKATAVTCFRCVNKLVDGENLEIKK